MMHTIFLFWLIQHSLTKKYKYQLEATWLGKLSITYKLDEEGGHVEAMHPTSHFHTSSLNRRPHKTIQMWPGAQNGTVEQHTLLHTLENSPLPCSANPSSDHESRHWPCHVSPTADITRGQRVLSQSPEEDSKLWRYLHYPKALPCLPLLVCSRPCTPSFQPILPLVFCKNQQAVITIWNCVCLGWRDASPWFWLVLSTIARMQQAADTWLWYQV
jgi:hypothetical protein